MNIISAIRERVERLSCFAELDVDAAALPSLAVKLSDRSVIEALSEVTALANDAIRLQAVLAGVTAHRSRHQDGHSGLAAVHGHPTPASLIQSITGGSKADATRQVRVGVSLLEGAGPVTSGAGDDSTLLDPAPVVSWHEPLRVALLDGRLTAAQHDAIRRGLGEPAMPTAVAADGSASEVDPAAMRAAWTLAAEGLAGEAQTMPVEELAVRARTLRDLLDPDGAEARHARRYENRGFRMWIDQDGQHRGRFAFDDEMGLWVAAMLDAALRPRRGGPRFVSSREKTAGEKLRDDPRSNEQLAYDVLTDVLRAGSLAEAADVFGARQPGVRVITVSDPASGAGRIGPRDAFGRLLGTGHAEDGGHSLPGSVIDHTACTNGTVEITVDRRGNPLDVGREQRHYTARQRLALVARDGGCRWVGCARPASYCEAHHCDHFADGGKTDVDRGILLCRHHHMTLHNQGWRISRDGQAEFVLHSPSGTATVLDEKAAWRWAWDPPRPPDRRGWRDPRVPDTILQSADA